MLVRWHENVRTVGLPGLHFHDLRHTGNTLAAPGTSTRDLMARMGHDSMRAALIYQHTTFDADRSIAAQLDAITKGHVPTETEDDDEDTEGPGDGRAA